MRAIAIATADGLGSRTASIVMTSKHDAIYSDVQPAFFYQPRRRE
jgi:hypothetical protein